MYAFLILPIFIVTYLFFSIRRVALGKKGAVLALAILSSIFLCFFFRTSFVFAAGQTALVIWVTQAMIIYLLSDILRAGIYTALKLQGKLPPLEARQKTRSKISRIALLLSVIVTAVFLGYGIPHNANYTLHEAEIKLPSATNGYEPKPFTAYYFSDLHIDPLFSKSKLERMVREVDSIKPDLIIFGGDLADITDSSMTAQGYDKLFKELTSKAASYGVVGNHEAYMEGMGSDPEGWMQKNGMTVLSDKSICNEKFGVCLGGRVDFQVSRKRDIPRRPLREFSPEAYCNEFYGKKSNADTIPDSTLALEKQNAEKQIAACLATPWILVDHQPKGIEKDYEGIKPLITLSGHTHDGQFFPVTAIIGFVWKLAYGLGEIDGYPWLVTSGIDSWGPPVRVGSDAEAWVLKFK